MRFVSIKVDCLLLVFYRLSFRSSTSYSFYVSNFLSCLSFYLSYVKSLVTVYNALLFFSTVFFNPSISPSYSMPFSIRPLFFSPNYKLILLINSISFLFSFTISSKVRSLFFKSLSKFFEENYFSSFRALC